MYSLYKGGPGLLLRKFFENLECRKSHLPHFEAYSLYFYFSLISFLYFFFCYSLKFSSLQVYSVNLRFTIVNSKSIYKYKDAYENGYDEYMVTYRYM